MSCSGGTAVEVPIEATISSTELVPPVVPSPTDSVVSAPKSPWGNLKTPDTVNAHPVSLRDIMSEQLASTLQIEEEEKLVKEVLQAEGIEPPQKFDLTELQSLSSPSDDCSSDFLIAQMLQMQYNKEHDHGLKKVEEKYNGSSKGTFELLKTSILLSQALYCISTLMGFFL